jgi:nucleoside-diphosphate-sugar epimerase
MEKEIVIVTGSCGRIGMNVVKRLSARYRIIGFELLKAIYAHPKEELVPVDLTSDESVAQAFTHISEMYGKKSQPLSIWPPITVSISNIRPSMKK